MTERGRALIAVAVISVAALGASVPTAQHDALTPPAAVAPATARTFLFLMGTSETNDGLTVVIPPTPVEALRGLEVCQIDPERSPSRVYPTPLDNEGQESTGDPGRGAFVLQCARESRRESAAAITMSRLTCGAAL